jgi:hypothetical protein
MAGILPAFVTKADSVCRVPTAPDKVTCHLPDSLDRCYLVLPLTIKEMPERIAKMAAQAMANKCEDDNVRVFVYTKPPERCW